MKVTDYQVEVVACSSTSNIITSIEREKFDQAENQEIEERSVSNIYQLFTYTI